MGKITLHIFKGWGARIFKLLVGMLLLAGGALAVNTGLATPLVASEPILLFIGSLAVVGGLVSVSSAFENDEVALTLGSDRNDPE